MKNYLKNPAKPSKMRFTIDHVKDGYAMYFASDNDKKYLGTALSMEDAQLAINKLMKTWGLDEKSSRQGLSTETYRKLNKITKNRLQLTAIELDKVRAFKFHEELLMLNYSLHMMSDSFDEVDYLFSACIDKSTKEHFKIARKHIEALLNAVLNSQIQGDADDYCNLAKNALYVKERLLPFISYVLSYKEENIWRLSEFDRVLENIMPDSFIEQEREKASSSIIKSLKGER